MDDFKTNRNDDNEVNENREVNENKETYTGSFEMNETPAAQENIPSSAEAKLEPDAKPETDSTSYTLSGAALGENAREAFDEPQRTTYNTAYAAQDTSAQDTQSVHSEESADNTYQSAPYSNQAYNNGYNYAHNNQGASVPYTEHVKKQKKTKDKSGKRSMRYVAAMLAAAVLNLAILGGAFALGHSFGSKTGETDSKQSLSQQLKTDSASSSSSDNTSNVTQTSSTDGEKDTTEVAKEVGPAVVGIKSTIQGQMSLFGGTSTSESQGSGIIISEDGYIVTNNHVIDGASAITVQLNTGSEFEATVVGTDSQTDLAVIKITPTEQLTVATLGDSSTVEVGETAIAIGNPMGLEFFGSVTQGIISAVNRSVTVDNRTMNYLQTDAAINSGNSGGALVNSKGEVIGINSVKVSASGYEGMGFAIPISDAKPVISDLLEYGYVKGRPVIGVSTRDVTEYMAAQYGWPQGAQIMQITTENAQQAGLEQGDIITKADDTTITKGSDLTEYKNTKSVGDTIKLEVYKYATGQTQTVEVVLSEQSPD